MTSRPFAILIALAFSNVAFAQTETAVMPKSMLGFLKPGMHLGVTSAEGTSSVSLRSYTDDDYIVAKALSKQLRTSIMSASSVAETNEPVRKELEAYVARLDLPATSRDDIMITPLTRTTFGTVVAVGDDYVLLHLDGEPMQKRIIPKGSIGTIYLDANPIRLFDRSARSRRAKVE